MKVIHFDPNRDGDYAAGVRDVLDYLTFRRDETAEWRNANPAMVAYQPRFREGQWEAIQIACAAVKKHLQGVAPPASELPPPGPSNIVVRTPNPLKAPERVEDQG